MSSSPYKNTQVMSSGALGVLNIRPVPAFLDDQLYEIEPQYNHRPDLLAYDLYKDNRLWWVFGQRNLDIIEDFIYDIKTGTKIYIPQPAKVKQMLD
tara:strand:+ start:3311 stop:3598 length:288 start_codon:yes stop_codon:yes gene_type:complete